MKMPKIFLSLDNCFAIKRWIHPKEWMNIAQELGFSVMEASTDNECDPLYNDSSYLSDWLKTVKKEQRNNNIRIGSFFTGYQSYRTIGLAHPDSRVRDKIVEEWFDPMLKISSELSSVLGVYFHAIPNEVLQSSEQYDNTEKILLDGFSKISALAAERKVKFCYEQMYSPQQTPWTIRGTQNLLKQVLKKSGFPMYVAIDVGHQHGQKKYQRPTLEAVKDELERVKKGESASLWVGSDYAENLVSGVVDAPIEKTAEQIMLDIEKHPYLFAVREDGSAYTWLEKLGCYSPIIHLQQTDGTASHHAPFTEEQNAKGIIRPKKVLEAIRRSYEQPHNPDMPPRADEIFLTFEIFANTAVPGRAILSPLRESLEYWRHAIPSDGLSLDELLTAQ